MVAGEATEPGTIMKRLTPTTAPRSGQARASAGAGSGTIAVLAFLLLVLAVAMPSALAAQDEAADDAETGAAPAPPTPADYGQWESLGFGILSPDGAWMALPVSRVNDEDELRIRRVGSDSVVVIGYGGRPTFSADGRRVAYSVGMSEDERNRLQERDERPEDSLGLLDLASGDTVLVAGVSSFVFSDDGRYLAMRRYPVGDADGDDEHGADLVVRDLDSGADVNFGNVGEYAWQEDGHLLAMTVDAADNAGNGVRVWNAESGALRVLDSSPSEYTGLGWRDDADDLAVLRAHEDEDREEATHAVLAWRDLAGRTRSFTFDPTERDGFPADTRIVDHTPPVFADDGRALFFGVKEWELTQEAKDRMEAEADSARAAEEEAEGEGQGEGETEAEGGGGADADSASAAPDEEEEKAGVEVWHSRDVDIIPRQKRTASQDRERSYLSVRHLDDDRLVTLTDDLEEQIQRVEGDEVAVGIDASPHAQDRMFGPRYQDIHLIDTGTAERRRVIERVEHYFGPSPGGRYLLYLRDDDYRAYDIRQDRDLNITGELPTIFVDTADDHTVEQDPPFYFAGWTDGDESVLVYDEYDVWRVRPDGSGQRITDGRADSVIHRYARVGWAEDQEAIDPGAPAYFSLTGEWSKRNGYAVASRLGRDPERRIWLDAAVGWLTKADSADVFAYRVASFDDSPDYFVAAGALAEGERLTNTNPFQADYAWGRSDLIEFENQWGRRLQGALFYPADYDPSRQYPMITYIYEIRSPAVHSYYVPSERSAYNTAVWTSQGYFVFQPDIVYRDRNPGLSAVEALVPAVEKVIETGMVDPERIGLVGHSWGGYQTAFVPTQTDIFAAAVAGAPLTELTSMYLSIYWNSGGTDARIFEISQGRMEVPPWQDWESYDMNSPVYHIENLNTPMLVAFGDEDGAVDWDQGTIFYNAARRAGKEMVLLVYAGENHGLAEEANQIDYHRRINEWFAHYLKGEPAPAWMSEGVPFLEQEEGEAVPATASGAGR
jgi:dipeptidyl aminopeptidase/acylaminoacyl peptidase